MCYRLPSQNSAKSSIVNITAHHDDTGDKDDVNYVKNKKLTTEQHKHNHEPKTDEEILKYVIENSFKSSRTHRSRLNGHSGQRGDTNDNVIRDTKTPSPKLDQEDMDILNSIVPEPSIVIVPEPPKQTSGNFFRDFDILSCFLI